VTWIAQLRFVVIAVVGFAICAYAADKKDNAKASGQAVDSGSFGIFVKGQRVLTETFSVRQENGISVVKSQLQEAGKSGASQKAELEMNGSGELVKYDWSDDRVSLEVTPKNEFLIEKISTGPSSKPAEQPFLMPSTSPVLDNNFFIDREILAWRYLATNCTSESGSLKCKKGPLEFGVLVPQDHTSMRVKLELEGREKISIHGKEQDLLRLDLKGENFDWTLWVDDKDQFKLMRVVIADDNTEVVRD
jgi:hypothetical protein